VADSVPTYGDPQVQLADRPAPKLDPRTVNADSFGAGIADATQRSAMQVSGIQRKAKQEADQTAVFDAVNKQAAAMNHVLWDPDTGAMNQKGSNAFGQPDRVQTEYQKLSDQFEGELTDPDQKRAFREISDRQYPDTQATVLRHVGQQTEVYKHQTYDDTVANLQTSALNHIGQPEAQGEIDKALELSKHTRALQMPGADAQTLDRINATDASNLHADVVGDLLTSGNYVAAKGYFDQNKAAILPQQRAALEKSVGDGSVRALGQAESARIFAPGKSLDQMYSEADQIQDQRVQAETKSRLDASFHNARAAKEQASTDLYKKGLGIIASDPRGVNAIPVQQLNQLQELDGEKYAALMEVGRRTVKREDITTPEGNTLLIRFRSALAGSLGEQARNEALATDPMIFAPVMSTNDLRDTAKTWDDAKKGRDMTGVAAEHEIAASTLKLNGFDPELHLSDNKPANIEATAFYTAFRKAIEVDKAAGKKLTPSDMQTIANRLMTPVQTGTGFFGGAVLTPTFMLGIDRATPSTALGGPSVAGLTLSDFTDDQVAAVKTELRAKGGSAKDDTAVLRILRARASSGMTRTRGQPTGAQGPSATAAFDGSYGN
jgi:hypothetical protein